MEATQTQKKGYPLGYWISCLTYTFERFAFYGGKPLLIVFLVTSVAKGGLGLEPAKASIVAVNLTAFTYIAPLIGGYICDHWLGARYAVSIGCIIMGIGYIIGWKANDLSAINLMIIVVAIGTGLFKGNLAAIIGRLFEDQSQMDSAFSIQYSFVNIGAFFGSLITGILYLNQFKQGEVLGFRPVFLLCGIIVIIGGIVFTLFYGSLKGQGKKPFKFYTDEKGNIIGEAHQKETEAEAEKEAKAPLTKPERNAVWAIIFVSFASIIFWLFYYQQETALTIYMTKFVDMHIAGKEIAPQHLTTTWNGLLCIFLSLAAAKLWQKLSERPQGDLSMFQKVTLSFVFLGIAYAVLTAMEFSRGVGADATHQASVLWLFLFSTILTIAEICFSPLGNSFVSKFAPKKYLSVMMGVWIIATFFASKASGYIEVFVGKLGIMTIFVTFMIVSFVFAIIMFALTKPLNGLLKEHDEN